MSSADRFVEWARASKVPLAPAETGTPRYDLTALAELIGDATVVTFGEGIHCATEPLEFRNQLFQYLVHEKGFTAIAIESGIVEGRIVHDYVHGSRGDLDDVMAQGISWTFDGLPQNRTLIEWLRQYNENPRQVRKLNFYGFDVPGSPANTDARRGHDTALIETLAYLSRVDGAVGASFHARLDALIPRLQFDLNDSSRASGYGDLDTPERDAITAAIADLIARMERREARYTEATSSHEYAWAYRAAVGARQMDDWLRQVETHPLAAADARDRAQADNLDWIIRQEGASGKVMVFAHRGHLATTPVRWLGYDAERPQQPAGTYLKRRYGKQMITIAHVMGKGEVGCGGYRAVLATPEPGSIADLAGQVGSPCYLLDLRNAPDSVSSWLNQPHRLAHGSHVFEMAVGRAFDILFYTDVITPAFAQRNI